MVVNIGSDAMKPKRRRAPRQALQKNNVVNKQQTTPTQINVPQALPIQQQPQQQPMNELIKYLRESEKQKEIIKEQDKKINELEKDKKDKKTIKAKPKQKQKQRQKQSQKVIVNIGSNVVKSRRRATGQALEKKKLKK